MASKPLISLLILRGHILLGDTIKKDLLNFKLEGSVVVLAGALKGIGFELAKLLVCCEARVLIVGRTKKRATHAVKLLRDLNPRADVDHEICDLSNRKGRNLLSEQIKSKYPMGINHLVSFIGTGKTPFGMHVNIDVWKEIFEKNFFSVVDLINLCESALKITKKNNSIIITSAIAGLERVPAPQSYSCSKAALSSYVSHLANELAKNDIRVIGINPGNVFFENGRWEQIIKEQGMKKIQREVLSTVAMKRFGLAEEIAWTYLMALSPRNSFMTGTNIVVDGQQISKTI